MLVFESMIAAAAEKAGMKVPPNELLDAKDKESSYSREEYPHFAVFSTLQLGRAMTGPTEHWDNAFVIAAIPEEEIRTMTLMDFAARGVTMVMN